MQSFFNVAKCYVKRGIPYHYLFSLSLVENETNSLTVLDENFPVIDAELLGDTLSTAIVVVYGNDNDIAVNIDKATLTYKINIQSSSDGEDTTITNQQVIDIISTYLEGYTYLEW